VSYHFGSLQALIDEAIEDALGRYLDAQQEAVGALERRVHPRGTSGRLCPADDHAR
jgi:AcrR family transcriptional regulator